MDLTDKNKKYIDRLSYENLLSSWRFSSAGNPWFQGETGEYWCKRMAELRDVNPTEAVRASKSIGW